MAEVHRKLLEIERTSNNTVSITVCDGWDGQKMTVDNISVKDLMSEVEAAGFTITRHGGSLEWD